MAGMIENPKSLGPQAPKRAVPSHAPIKPANIFPATPPGISRPINKLANQPIIPLTINNKRKSKVIPPLMIRIYISEDNAPYKGANLQEETIN